MSVCVYSVFVLSCVGSSLATGWSPVKESYRLWIRLRNWRRVQGPNWSLQPLILRHKIIMYSNLYNNVVVQWTFTFHFVPFLHSCFRFFLSFFHAPTSSLRSSVAILSHLLSFLLNFPSAFHYFVMSFSLYLFISSPLTYSAMLMFWEVRIENSMRYKTEHQMRSYMRPAWRGKKSTQMGSCLKCMYEYYNIHQINVTDGAAYSSWHIFQYFI
jgi:hypothetical protein